MTTFDRGARGKRAGYRISASREGAHLDIDEAFWDDAVVDPDNGLTQLDLNITQVLQEIRAALYTIATIDLTRH